MPENSPVTENFSGPEANTSSVNPPPSESREIAKNIEKILKELDESLKSPRNQTERIGGSKEITHTQKWKLPQRNSWKLKRSLSESCISSYKAAANEDLQMQLVIDDILKDNVSEKYPKKPRKVSGNSQKSGTSGTYETYKKTVAAKITKRREEICLTPKSGTPKPHQKSKKINFEEKNEKKSRSRRITVAIDLPRAKISKRQDEIPLDLDDVPLKKRRCTVDEKSSKPVPVETGRQLRPRKPPALKKPENLEPPTKKKKQLPKKPRRKTVDERTQSKKIKEPKSLGQKQGKSPQEQKTGKSAGQVRTRRMTVHETSAAAAKTLDPPKKSKEVKKPVTKTQTKTKKDGGKKPDEKQNLRKSPRILIRKEKVEKQLIKSFIKNFK